MKRVRTPRMKAPLARKRTGGHCGKPTDLRIQDAALMTPNVKIPGAQTHGGQQENER